MDFNFTCIVFNEPAHLIQRNVTFCITNIMPILH
jgi:hypothetical protein